MTPLLPRPRAVLFDLFHTLVSVAPPATVGERAIPDILGIPAHEWQRRFYDDDTAGRCLGRVRDAVLAMRTVTHSIDPTVEEARILEAVASRRRRFHACLVRIEPSVLDALDRLRVAGIRTALVSDAGADDVEAWERSPLRERLDAVVFSFEVGMRKPDLRIYRDALRRVGVEAPEAVFVGDGGSDEHRGAREVGMRTVLVTRYVSQWWPERIAPRRAHADFVFEDVPTFVAALGL